MLPKAPCITTSILLATWLLLSLPQSVSADLSPSLMQMISTDRISDADNRVSVVVFLDDQPVRAELSRVAGTAIMTRSARIKAVVSNLKSFSGRHLPALERFLVAHNATEMIRHWVVPAVTASVPVSCLSELAAFPGVRLVAENGSLIYEPPVTMKSAPLLASGVSDQLNLLNIPILWNRGLTGHGRLVCSFDTGVEQGHPALAARWRGNHAPLSSSWFSTISPAALPGDKVGHGTHTMGVMVGATLIDTFGVAPDAEWITAGVIDQGKSLSGTISDILQAFQWALDPDGDPATTDDVPDVILNSWGIPKGLFAPCDETFYTVIDNVEAAGIVTIFACGNEGPAATSIRNPADRASSPTNSFAVGAVNNSLTIADFSSRGPSSCDATAIKPEVVAPGVGVRSSYKGGGYHTMSGTSMAAPYVAGLVVLMRQYNPDATVQQIKNALLQSCTDLGGPGEDNAYGYGLPDAGRVLDYLPIPTEPEFTIERVIISEDGVAAPGEEFDLQLLLRNAAGNLETVTSILVVDGNDSVVVVEDQAVFFFGEGGTAAVNTEPFRVRFDSAFYHGQEISCQLYLEAHNGMFRDTADFTITVGIPPEGEIAAYSTGRLDYSISDFGQYGFAPGSIYNVQGEGFRFNGGANLLYEAGIVVGRNPLQLSCAVRDSLAQVAPSDFTPIEWLSAGFTDATGGFRVTASFGDTRSEIPIPVTVIQQTISYPDTEDNGLLILRYYLRNNSNERLTNLHFGFLADFDLTESGESATWDETMALLGHRAEAGPQTGLLALKNLTSFKTIDNGPAKRGFTRTELYDMISSGVVEVDDTLMADIVSLVSGGPFIIEPGDSIEVTLALLAGQNAGDLYANAAAARERYLLATDADEIAARPETFTLSQNYPNPFNPATTIQFSLPEAGEVSLEVYNILGQRVNSVVTGTLPPGTHTVRWDGTDGRGSSVASGVYFYRLTVAGQTETRKMTLLK